MSVLVCCIWGWRLFDVFWALLLLPASLVLVRYLVLTGEERYLDQRFGDEYRRYKERVPRWLPRPDMETAPIDNPQSHPILVSKRRTMISGKSMFSGWRSMDTIMTRPARPALTRAP